MDQHPRGAGSGQRFQCITDRRIAGRPAFDQTETQRRGAGHVIGVNHKDHKVCNIGEGQQAVGDDRLACQQLPLLGNGTPGPRPAPGRNDDGRDCHAVSVLPPSVLRERRKPDNAALDP